MNVKKSITLKITINAAFSTDYFGKLFWCDGIFSAFTLSI
jgi:hypothetical protein